jgi:preprotein translocase subunit SecG
MEWLVQLEDWLESVVAWMVAIFAVLALVLSIYNTYTLHTLRRELEDLREEARQSPTENAEPTEEDSPARSTRWW